MSVALHSVSGVLLLQRNFSPFKQLSELVQMVSSTLLRLAFLDLPPELKVKFYCAGTTECVEAIQPLLKGYQEQFGLDISAITLDMDSSMGQGAAAGSLAAGGNNSYLLKLVDKVLHTVDGEYVQFIPLCSILDEAFYKQVQSELQYPIVKTLVQDKDMQFVVDLGYEQICAKSPLALCKNFGSLLLKREWLLQNQFVDYLAKYSFVSDISLSAAVGDMSYKFLFNFAEAFTTDGAKSTQGAGDSTGNHAGNNAGNVKPAGNAELTGDTKSTGNVEPAEGTGTATTSTSGDNNNNDNNQTNCFKINNLSVAKSLITYVPEAKLALPEVQLLSKNTVLTQIQQFIRFFQCKYAYVSSSGFAYPFVIFLDLVNNCEGFELKQILCGGLSQIYHVVKNNLRDIAHDKQAKLAEAQGVAPQDIVYDDERMKIVCTLHEKLDEIMDKFCDCPLSKAYQTQDILFLSTLSQTRALKILQKSYSQLQNSHNFQIRMAQKLKALALTGRKLNTWPEEMGAEPLKTYAWPQPFANSPTPVDFEHSPWHEVHPSSLPDSSNDSSNLSADSLSLAAPADLSTNLAEPIYVLSVVNDPELYVQLFGLNPFLRAPNIHLEPRLNPAPGSTEIKGLPEIYNSFLDELGDKEGWLIFCHNDFEFAQDMNARLAGLDKNSLYGPGGAFTVNSQGKQVFVLRCGTLFRPSHVTCYLAYNQKCIEKFQHPDLSEIDTVDCMCLIMHSSLVKRYHLRFDEHLRFDLVTEDFCINARLNHNIATRILDFCSVHHSSSGVNSLTQAYHDSHDYLRAKYPHTAMAGTCSMIGGAVPQDAQFTEDLGDAASLTSLLEAVTNITSVRTNDMLDEALRQLKLKHPGLE